MVDGQPVLRPDDDDAAHRVSFFELFFDLVFVFAVTQLSHGLAGHLDLRGAAETLLLLLAVWWAWVYTTWATNWLNPDSTPVRLMLIGVMALSLVMAAVIPDAFGDGGLLFALAYATIQIGRSAFVLWAVRRDRVRFANFRRILVWNTAAAVIWIVGGLAEGTARDAIWIAALAVDYAAPAARFWTPGLGASRVEDWTVTGSYMSERFKLFIILSLGESILVTGITLSDIDPDLATVAAFALAFVGSVALWWVYFHRSAGAGETVLERSEEPGRLARSAYTYFHLPMAAGIIVTAVADEIMIMHPGGHADLATVGVTIGGPILFLAGHALYKWAMFGVVSVQRLVAIGVLAAIVPFGTSLSPLVLGGAAVAVVLGVAVAETLIYPSTVDADEELVEAA